ncbi:MAG: NAD(P)-binding protein, partial [Planctomycetota bacterium]
DTDEIECLRYDDDLPFTPLDLVDADLATLIGQCHIDHSIAPVKNTRGGSTEGYARWNDFLQNRLRHYSERRNDAVDTYAVSRLSPYLHYGAVSPFRVARQAAANPDSEKYLDELLTWRELAFHFCYRHEGSLDSIEALPGWARETLQRHADVPRSQDFSWEQLSRGQTGNLLWDTAQRGLLRHGEMHNNVRMTWGKAMLDWTSSPQRALQMILDLNHRYALDGRDPCSYGGILWCLGQFDRPFLEQVAGRRGGRRGKHQKGQRVAGNNRRPKSSGTEKGDTPYGTVRMRSIAAHRNRLDMHKYQQWSMTPVVDTPPRVAIIGAGLGGLFAARTLTDFGFDVELFEKSRGVGGRLATRRMGQPTSSPPTSPPAASSSSTSSQRTEENAHDDVTTFDHGAQYFTVRDARFGRFVQSWIHNGVADAWLAPIVKLDNGNCLSNHSSTPRYVGKPRMNAIAKHLATDLTIHSSCRISAV